MATQVQLRLRLASALPLHLWAVVWLTPMAFSAPGDREPWRMCQPRHGGLIWPEVDPAIAFELP